MSYLGFNQQVQQQQLIEAGENPIGTKSDVGFFSNSIGAAADGLYSGLVAKPDQALWAGIDAVVSPVSRLVNENTPLKDTSPEFIAEQRKLAEQQVRRLTPDAATTGTAGQVLHGLFDIGGQAVAGTVLGGPLGGAAAVTSLQGFSEYEKLRAEGVDSGTAQEVAIVQGATAGAGVLLPMSLGLRAGGALAEGVGAQISRSGGNTALNVAGAATRATPDILYAAGTNVAFGMAQRGLTSSTLRNHGYVDMADQYQVFDRQSIAIDAVLGVAFGGIGRFVSSRGENVRTPAFSEADVDAALAANSSHHAEIDIAPGVPINVLSRDAHARALQQAMRNASEGNPIDVSSIIEPASFSEIPGRRNLIAQSIDEALSVTEDGTTARSLEIKTLEDRASQVLSRGERSALSSDIYAAERSLNDMQAQRDAISGMDATTSSARRIQNRELSLIDQQIGASREGIEQLRARLLPSEPGGQYFEARAELARRQQAETDLNAQAMSYYKTAEVRAPAEVAQPRQQAVQRSADARAQDVDVQYAEQSLATSPDMLITVLDEDGNSQTRSAREAFDEASRQNEQAIQDSSLFDVAVACFLRG